MGVGGLRGEPASAAFAPAVCGDGFATVAGLGSWARLHHAARAAVEAALLPLGGQSPDILAVFACPGGDEFAEQLDDVAAAAAERGGAAHLIGTSAQGVCGAGKAAFDEPAVSAWAAVVPDLSVRSFHLEVIRHEDGLAVVGMPEPGEHESLAVLFADPYSFPADSFVERSAGLPGSVGRLRLIGGLASAPSGAGRTRLFVDGRSVNRGAVGLLLGSSEPVSPRPVVSQGCRPVGPEMVVTAAEDNLLLGLAGQPALARLLQVLEELEPDERQRFGVGPQIGIAMDEYADERDLGDFLIRPVIGVDEARSAVAIGDVVEVGRTVRFHLRDPEAARTDLVRRLEVGGPGRGALLVSCNGRGPGMFGSADHDVQLVRESLSSGAGPVPVAGFFAGGEIGPVGGRNWLHGFTASMLVLP